MASITLTPSEKEIQAFLEHYQTSLAPSKNPYIRYFLKLPQATVSIYTSGKVLLQGEGAEKYASFFGYQVVEETSGQNLPLIGTDEVGNGSYFGGLAVVASFVTPDQHDFLRKLGVGDSKTLTDQKIRQIAPILKEKIQHQRTASPHPASTTRSSETATTLFRLRLPSIIRLSISSFKKEFSLRKL